MQRELVLIGLVVCLETTPTLFADKENVRLDHLLRLEHSGHIFSYCRLVRKHGKKFSFKFSKMILEFLFSILLILLAYMIYLQWPPTGFPPGPFSLPILGNLLHLGMEPYKSLMKMKKTYGNIIGIYLGSRRAVAINDYEILKEAFYLPTFNARCTMNHLAEPETGIFRGLAFSSGRTWAEQRRFVATYIQSGLRNRTTMENLVKNEILELNKQLAKDCGHSKSTEHVFNIPVVNALWVIVAGKRYDLDDQEFLKMAKHVEAIVTSLLLQGVLNFYPRFAEAFPKLSGFKIIMDNMKSIYDFMGKIVEEHKVTCKQGEETDFVDAYLNKIKLTTNANSTFFGKSGEINLVHNMTHLFMGGTETVATTLRWLLFLMAHYPEVQEKFTNSVRTKSKGNLISLNDRSSLPYVEAVIEEVLRFSSVSPVGLLHETEDDVEFYGYRIPKGTVVIPNHYAILHDPEIWGDPQNFRPERFLTDNGTKAIHRGSLITFGIGRRICPGETLARDELFLFATGIFQNFKVQFDPSLPTPNVDHKIGNILVPVDHRVIFHKIID